MKADVKLERTVDLVRSDVFPQASRTAIVDSLTATKVRLRADEREMSSAAGQTALVASAIASAQCGVELLLDLPAVEVLPHQPPLGAGPLLERLVEHTADLITPARPDAGEPVDLSVVFGGAAGHKDDLRLTPQRGGFELMTALGDPLGASGSWAGGSEFGALFGGTAVAAEAFRAAMRRLARAGERATLAKAVREPQPIRLALPEGSRYVDLGPLDVISAGAITQGMLFALLRLTGVEAVIRVFDHDIFDWSNLNRYPLSSENMWREPKALLLERFSTDAVEIKGVQNRYDEAVASSIPLSRTVALGVDHIPSRWLAQRHAPGSVIVGATSHFEVVVSEHPHGEPCAGCLYRDGADDGQPIPTVSFVSAFAGIMQAFRLVTAVPEIARARQTRGAPLNLAGSRPLVELGVARRVPCPAGCEQAVSA